jgi:hypothetical protein
MEPEGSLPPSQEPATCPYPVQIYYKFLIFRQSLQGKKITPRVETVSVWTSVLT